MVKLRYVLGCKNVLFCLNYNLVILLFLISFGICGYFNNRKINIF